MSVTLKNIPKYNFLSPDRKSGSDHLLRVVTLSSTQLLLLHSPVAKKKKTLYYDYQSVIFWKYEYERHIIIIYNLYNFADAMCGKIPTEIRYLLIITNT